MGLTYLLCLIWALSVFNIAYADEPELSGQKAMIELEKGSIEISFFKEAPGTVSNFIELAEKGFFNGSTFSKIVPGFYLLAGETSGNNLDGPGYCIQDELHKDLKHDSPGVVTMANSGRHSAGSGFMITLAAKPHLDGRNAVFGKITKGMKHVVQIAGAKTSGTRPVSPVVIKNVRILEKGVLSPFKKIQKFTAKDLEKIAAPTIDTLLKGVAKAQELGKLTSLRFMNARSKCGESQINYRVDFEKRVGARLLVYGDVEGASYRIDQFQFHTGSPVLIGNEGQKSK